MEDDSGAYPMLAAPAAAAPKNSRSLKKKSVKQSKAAGSGAAAPKASGGGGGNVDRNAGAAASGAARKKKAKDEVVFDASDLTAPLPVNLRIYCLSLMTNRYHEARVLDRRMRDAKFQIQSVPWPPSPNPPLPPAPEGIQPDFSLSHPHIYYIHYQEWDRRMDEWVYRDRICLPTQLQMLQPPSYNIVTIAPQKEANDATATSTAAAAAASAAAVAAGKKGAGKEKKDGDDGGGGDEDEDMKEEDAGPAKKKGKSKEKGKGSGKGKGKGGGKAGKSGDAKSSAFDSSAAAASSAAAGAGGAPPSAGGDPHGGSLGGHGNFSEEDIRLHEEATKVKNIESIVMGKFHMSTWYYSPLPSEYNQYNVLHICEFCLNFFGYESELKRHSQKCALRHPPGNEIYRSDEKNVRVAVFEVDGAREKVYCQNLCYIAKLFLDHKTLEVSFSFWRGGSAAAASAAAATCALGFSHFVFFFLFCLPFFLFFFFFLLFS